MCFWGCLKEVPFVTVRLTKESSSLQAGPDSQLQGKTQAGKTTLIVDISPKAAVICREEGA